MLIMIPQCDISAEFYIFIFFLKQKLNRFYSLPRERISFSKEKRENELKTHSIIFYILDASWRFCLLYPVSGFTARLFKELVD